MYFPSPGTVSSFTSFPSLSTRVYEVMGASSLPSVNLGVPVCSSPCLPSDVSGSAVGAGSSGVTVGVYFAVAGVPFLSHI